MDRSYVSAVSSPTRDCEIVDVGDGDRNGDSEGSSAVSASSSPPVQLL